MSDYLPETKDVSTRYCPACEPWHDPLVEILVEDRCATHRPSLAGLDDARVESGVGILGNSDTDGATQAAWAALLRG